MSHRQPRKKFCREVWSPDLLERWHPTLNGRNTPDNTSYGSGKSISLFCIRNIYRDGQRRVCPKPKRAYSILKHPACTRCQSTVSKFECRVYAECRSILGGNVQWGDLIDGLECDILISDRGIGVEVDGGYWHRNLVEADKEKNRRLNAYGIQVYRLRGEGLSAISERDVCHGKHEAHLKIIKRLMESMLRNSTLPKMTEHRLHAYLRRRDFADKDFYQELVRRLPGPPLEKSLAHTHADVAAEWNYELNDPVTPEDVTRGEQEPRLWDCRIPEHPSYEATCNERTRKRGSGCPICGNRITLYKESFGHHHPDKVKWWSPKNKKTAYELKPTYGPTLRWRDEAGREWKQTIRGLLKNGPSHVYYRSLGQLYPELIPYWHEDNEETIYEVPAGGTRNGVHLKAKFYKPNGKVHVAWIANKAQAVRHQRSGRRSRWGPDGHVNGNELRRLQNEWLRRHAGEYAENLFSEIGFSRTSWYKWLNGDGIRGPNLIRIARFFEVDPETLIGS